MAVFYVPDFARTGGTAVVVLVIAGGLLYTAVAVVYGLKRPDPSPSWFGFHEVFHALTIAAFTAHYTAIVLAVTVLSHPRLGAGMILRVAASSGERQPSSLTLRSR